MSIPMSMIDGPGHAGRFPPPRWAALLGILGLVACSPTSDPEPGAPEEPRVTQPASPSLYLEMQSLKSNTLVPKALISLSSGQRQLADARGTLLEKLPVGRQLLHVQAPDYYPTVLAFDMAEGVQAGARLKLIPLGEPLDTFDASEETTLSMGGATVTVPPGALLDKQGNPLQGQVDAFMTALDLERGQLVAAPGALEGIPAPGAEPVGLESLGMVALAFQPHAGNPSTALVAFARGIKIRGSAPGSIRLGSQGGPGPRTDAFKSGASSASLLPRVVAWRLDPDSGHWIPTGELGHLKESSTEPGRLEWEVTLDNPPPVLHLALPFWWRSPLASRDNPLQVPEPRWAETACLAVRVLDDADQPMAGRVVEARGVGYTGLSRALTGADGRARLEVMRNQAVAVDAGEQATPVPPVSDAGPCTEPEAKPVAVELRVAARTCTPGAALDCDYGGPVDTRGKGVCRASRRSCDVEGTGWSATCESEVRPQEERCDNTLDDDCDGDTNETCATLCQAGETRPCYAGHVGSEGVGLCQAGTQTCNGSGTDWNACTGQLTPRAEDCANVLDDDCDGQINEAVSCVWASAGSMASARSGHAATLLGNGKVLVSGGQHGSEDLRTAELYDPVTHRWSPAGAMPSPRSAHAATLLANGKVLVSGGYGPGILNTTALYDPGTNTWSLAGAMASPRVHHTATLLGNGQVLVSGGQYNSEFQGTAELYDPGTNIWSPAGSMSSPRGRHTATLLNNGKVLVTGGRDEFGMFGWLNTAEVYDPATNTWSSVSSMSTVREAHTATRLKNGKVLVTGGLHDFGVEGPLKTAEAYDPGTNTWSPASPMTVPRVAHRATLLENGKVLVTGGEAGQTVEVYDPATDTWSAAGLMANSPSDHTATPLRMGQVLVVGSGSSVEVYSP